MQKSLEEVDFLLNSYVKGEKVKNGVKVAIVGRPNTGKSSILNALLNYDKAIVSATAGTTRDVVEGSLSINGVKFDFYDTAGIRETDNDIEKLGIERSEKLLKSSDIAVAVIDGSEDLTEEDKSILNAVSGKESIIVYNKADKPIKIKNQNAITLSAKTGEGVEQLKAELYKRVFGGGVDLNSQYVAEERHYYALQKAKNALIDGLNNVDLVPLDLVAEDIKSVWESLGEITGKTASEEIIDEIFKKFCVGK
jgi:tRNA modification GTPase